MDASALASDLLLWEKKRKELDELEAAIRDSVLQLGKTQTVGNVRASYSAGRKRYDYEGAASVADFSRQQLEPYQEIHTNWRAVCEHYGLVAEVAQGKPSVSIKLIG